MDICQILTNYFQTLLSTVLSFNSHKKASAMALKSQISDQAKRISGVPNISERSYSTT